MKKLIKQKAGVLNGSNEEDKLMEVPYKIVFMDCNMPLIDGFETTVKIIELCNKHKFKKPHIIALTAYSKHELHMLNIDKKCK